MNSKIIMYVVSAALVFAAVLMYAGTASTRLGSDNADIAAFNDLFDDGDITLPIAWNDIGVRLQKLGVIDRAKLDSIYAGRGGMSASAKKILDETVAGPIVMTKENSAELLNIFWAFGLANKNPILEQGPMMDPRYGGAKGFASTGGWSLAAGSPMDHYSMHAFAPLTPGQQEMVDRMSKNIYRPCCDNATYFPDCNHGMAMLGLLELMAAQNVSEQEMYSVALKVQEKWFPDTYVNIREYLKIKNIARTAITPEILLGKDYSSASGYNRIVAALNPKEQGGGGSCGV